MPVEIDPQELGFRRPFTTEVAEVLKIRNTAQFAVAFKVKTTAPKQYCVRPNSGRIDPQQEVEVSVLLQAMKQDPAHDAKCRDKFLVQSVPITNDRLNVPVQDIWESVQKAEITERKIRVTWLPANGDSNGASAVTPMRNSMLNGYEATPDAPPAYSSPGEGDTMISSTAPGEHSPDMTKEYKSEPEGPTSTAATPMKDSSALEALKAKLTAAEAKIAALAKSDGGLRQRKVTGGGEKGAATEKLQEVVRNAPEGVSVQVVALLCLASFLLAYFFF